MWLQITSQQNNFICHERLLNPLGLNVAEIELSVLSKQCLKRRIDCSSKLKAELGEWEKERNQTKSKVSWQFSTEDARVKLKHLYPVFEKEESITIQVPS
jgi:hypothetical protein